MPLLHEEEQKLSDSCPSESLKEEKKISNFDVKFEDEIKDDDHQQNNLDDTIKEFS
jgi:hypothetical protein